jgi:GT2 family glycosyltransferase
VKSSDVSLVISVWNRVADLRENLAAIRQQTVPPIEVIVVDNASTDGTAEMVADEFPEVHLIRMPHSAYGACETFNIGFASARGSFVGILDDDVVLGPDWVEKMLAEFAAEPETTAVLSPKVVEPGMPDWHLSSPEVNRPRYMSTFRGCASMARKHAIREAGYYDERLFIFGNERDLTARLLNLGYRVKMVPSIEVFHKAPFGMRQGRRSLYYHVRNFWLYAFKYVPWHTTLAFPLKFVAKGLGTKKKSQREVTDAVGTIGLFDAIRGVPGGYWVCMRATLAAVGNLPYCLRRRQVCKAPDFELPLKRGAAISTGRVGIAGSARPSRSRRRRARRAGRRRAGCAGCGGSSRGARRRPGFRRRRAAPARPPRRNGSAPRTETAGVRRRTDRRSSACPAPPR